MRHRKQLRLPYLSDIASRYFTSSRRDSCFVLLQHCCWTCVLATPCFSFNSIAIADTTEQNLPLFCCFLLSFLIPRILSTWKLLDVCTKKSKFRVAFQRTRYTGETLLSRFCRQFQQHKYLKLLATVSNASSDDGSFDSSSSLFPIAPRASSAIKSKWRRFPRFSVVSFHSGAPRKNHLSAQPYGRIIQLFLSCYFLFSRAAIGEIYSALSFLLLP